MDPATALTIASFAVSAVSSFAQGAAAKQAAEYNAQMAEREAQETRDAAQIEEEQHRDNLRRFIARQKAAAGASGFSDSSAGLLAEEAAAEGERDVLTIRYSGSVAAAKSLSEAALQRYQGKAAYTQGVLGAGASILKGAGGVMQKPKKPALKKKLGS